MTKPSCETCKTDAHVALSFGPGRTLGSVARKLDNVTAPLPDDFKYWLCCQCFARVLTPETVQAFKDFEDQL